MQTNLMLVFQYLHIPKEGGQLTSPYIDLTNDSNVTLSFEHAYRWCCSNNHELIVSINDGTGWENSTNFQVNELGNVNDASGTVKVDIIITEIAALKDSVQIRFDRQIISKQHLTIFG